MVQTFDEFDEAFLQFLVSNCVPATFGYIGVDSAQYTNREIRIVLKENGSGYIHLLGEDSDTMNFRTMNHFRSQGMITPSQREQINKLTQSKANKIARQHIIELEERLAVLSGKIEKMRNILQNDDPAHCK